MATDEQIKRSLEDMIPRVEWNKPLVGQVGRAGQAIGAQAGIAGLQGPVYPGPVCAHLIVGYVRQHLGGGSERGWWQCTQCDCKFVPSGTTKD